MKKAVLKVYIKGRIRPLFVAEIYDDVEMTIQNFLSQFDTTTKVIKFGQIGFNRDLFHHYEIIYK